MRNKHSPRAAADMNVAAGNAGARALPRRPAPAATEADQILIDSGQEEAATEATEADQILIDSGWRLPAQDKSKRRQRHG